MVYSWYVDEHCCVFTHVMSYDVHWDRLGNSGRAPCTRETARFFVISVGLPDIHEYSAG